VCIECKTKKFESSSKALANGAMCWHIVHRTNYILPFHRFQRTKEIINAMHDVAKLRQKVQSQHDLPKQIPSPDATCFAEMNA